MRGQEKENVDDWCLCIWPAESSIQSVFVVEEGTGGEQGTQRRATRKHCCAEGSTQKGMLSYLLSPPAHPSVHLQDGHSVDKLLDATW